MMPANRMTKTLPIEGVRCLSTEVYFQFLKFRFTTSKVVVDIWYKKQCIQVVS